MVLLGSLCHSSSQFFILICILKSLLFCGVLLQLPATGDLSKIDFVIFLNSFGKGVSISLLSPETGPA